MKGIHVTKRLVLLVVLCLNSTLTSVLVCLCSDLFYTDVKLFKSQLDSDDVLEDVSLSSLASTSRPNAAITRTNGAYFLFARAAGRLHAWMHSLKFEWSGSVLIRLLYLVLMFLFLFPCSGGQ
jgi:hypothetical protein